MGLDVLVLEDVVVEKAEATERVGEEASERISVDGAWRRQRSGHRPMDDRSSGSNDPNESPAGCWAFIYLQNGRGPKRHMRRPVLVSAVSTTVAEITFVTAVVLSSTFMLSLQRRGYGRTPRASPRN